MVVDPPVGVEPPVIVEPPVVVEPPVIVDPPVVVEPPVIVELVEELLTELLGGIVSVEDGEDVDIPVEVPDGGCEDEVVCCTEDDP